MTSGTEVRRAGSRDHVALFYAADEELIAGMGDHLLDGVRDGGTAIVVATAAHRRALEDWLAQRGIDVEAARAVGSYLALDAEATMRRFLVGAWPDPARFWQVVSPLVRPRAGARRPARVYGEMVALLWDDGLVNAAIEVEALWNELAGQYPFSLLCGYPVRSISGDDHLDGLDEVCRVHTAVAGVPPHLG